MRLLVLLLALPLGCSRADATRADVHVVARVNGVEISSAETPSAQALERVIERELLVQQALAAGLDHDPEVRRAVDDARRRVLAQAWLDRRAAPRAQATREEVRAFYGENPALFAERRVYRLRELTVPAGAQLVEWLRARTAEAKDLEELAEWLRGRNVRFSAATLAAPAEHLPLGILPRLARMQPGEIAVFALPPGASVIELLHAEAAPLDEEEAAPLIEEFLARRKRLELAEAELKRLRQVAAIEYVGDFKARKR